MPSRPLSLLTSTSSTTRSGLLSLRPNDRDVPKSDFEKSLALAKRTNGESTEAPVPAKSAKAPKSASKVHENDTPVTVKGESASQVDTDSTQQAGSSDEESPIADGGLNQQTAESDESHTSTEPDEKPDANEQLVQLDGLVLPDIVDLSKQALAAAVPVEADVQSSLPETSPIDAESSADVSSESDAQLSAAITRSQVREISPFASSSAVDAEGDADVDAPIDLEDALVVPLADGEAVDEQEAAALKKQLEQSHAASAKASPKIGTSSAEALETAAGKSDDKSDHKESVDPLESLQTIPQAIESQVGATDSLTAHHRIAHIDGDKAVVQTLQIENPSQANPNRPASTSTHVPVSAVPLAPEQRFAEANFPQIVRHVQQDLLPNGGTMQIRLDPPELGALQVRVTMTDGVMTASFQTSNDDATKLLSHSLASLKQSLESQGVSVERLQVQQAPRDNNARNDDPYQQQAERDGSSHPEDSAQQQERQRRELMNRLWRKLTGGQDPLDLTA